VLDISDDSRVRILTLNRTEALNSFNEALYDATTDALLEAADDPATAVVVITGAGRAFCAGTDLIEMARRSQRDPTFVAGRHGFAGMIDVLTDFAKPLIIAVNGIGVGIGATILGYADLAFMSTAARLRCPFTSLGVAPEAASSFTFPQLIGRQNATWALMSSEWLSADDCVAMGLVWRACEPDELMTTTLDHARTLAALPISSLIETKATIVESQRDPIRAARARENAAFVKLMGGPANAEALKAFAEKRPPDFTALPPGW
jgi:enoyl-CoA hydratase/carnithine racemase